MKINPANLISVGRALSGFAAAFFLVEVGGDNASWIALAIIFGAMFSDIVDGRIARKFGFEGKTGELADLYADHILANCVWVVFSYDRMIPIWVPLITTTRDFVADWFATTGSWVTGLNGYEQLHSSKVGWLMTSRSMRAVYGSAKMVSWSSLILGIWLPIGFGVQVLVWLTVALCLIRAFPVLTLSWRSVLLFKPGV